MRPHLGPLRFNGFRDRQALHDIPFIARSPQNPLPLGNLSRAPDRSRRPLMQRGDNPFNAHLMQFIQGNLIPRPKPTPTLLHGNHPL